MSRASQTVAVLPERQRALNELVEEFSDNTCQLLQWQVNDAGRHFTMP